MSKVGYIYILTNQSFKDNCIKIGYSTNVEKRVRDLSGTGLPYDYEIYSTYEIPASTKADKALHKIIQMLNPNLRISPNREFFEIAPEEAYKVFEQMAIIHGCEDKLKLYKNDEADEAHKKGEVFSFTKCNIPLGSEITFINDDSNKATVVDNRKVDYQGEITYLSPLAQKLTGKDIALQGPHYFKYNGLPLQDYYKKYQINKN